MTIQDCANDTHRKWKPLGPREPLKGSAKITNSGYLSASIKGEGMAGTSSKTWHEDTV